jgi:hypothetical protein
VASSQTASAARSAVTATHFHFVGRVQFGR